MFLRVTNRWDFVAISKIGHIAYGAVLGVVVQRYALASERATVWAKKD
jgi:hypothetical protein